MKKISKKEDKKRRFIGLRVIKTVISVYVCFLISFVRNGIPFYSAIAAVLCMKSDYTNSLKVGKSRMIGTLIGGIYGFLAIIFIEYVNIKLFVYIHYLILSLFLIPIIYTNVFLKVSSSTYISCVVFFSITASSGRNMGPMYFTLNRMIDTLIGIVVSIVINLII